MKFCLTALALLASLFAARHTMAEGMPDNLRQQIDKHLIGNWEYTTTFDNKKTKSEVTWRWSVGGETIIEESNNIDQAFTSTQIGGWNPQTKSLDFHGFTSRGDTMVARYDQLTDEKWTGTGEGHWENKEWKSPIVIEWKKDGFRYQDTTDGKPFVVEAKPASTADAEKALATFGKFMRGTWTRTDNGVVREHVYRWRPGKKFMAVNGQNDPEPWHGVLGVDLSNGKLGWWGFFGNGTSGVVHLTQATANQWTFEGVDFGPDGPFQREVVVKKIEDHELHAVVKDTSNGETQVAFDEEWARKVEK